MVSFGPLYPNAQYTLAVSSDTPIQLTCKNVLLLPTACYLAISLASLLIFPQSLHSVVLGSTSRSSFEPSLALLRIQKDVLAAKRWSDLADKVDDIRGTQLGDISALSSKIKMLRLEMSHGRMGADDLGEVFEKGKELGVRAYTLNSVVSLGLGASDIPAGHGRIPIQEGRAQNPST